MLTCPACSHNNADDASFCNKCGAPFRLVCRECQRDNPSESAFCAGCGVRLDVTSPGDSPVGPISYTPRHLADKILRSRESMEGERRIVTVLFADAVGFTPLSEKIGEEEVYRLMQGCLQRMMDAVHRYEGTVTTFTGDGVMALFGAPIAHEDSARRAVAAGIEMQSSLDAYAADLKAKHPVECRFRVGLNTGPVVVGKISDSLDMDYTALGDTVNLASRMEDLARPGCVYLTDSTYRAIAGYFDCEPLGALTVKGKASPVVAYRAVRERSAVRTRLQVAAERGLTPFVGRAHELNVLRGYFAQAKRGQGQVVFLSGDAGLGKSRLLLEFRRSLLDEPATWLEGHCISYGKRIPYLPIADLVKANFGIEEGDNDARIIGRVDERVSGWDKHALATAAYLKCLLNVDPGDPAIVSMDPMARRADILDGLRALLLQESRDRPLVVVVEDLHLVDENSEDALRAIVDVVPTAPILMVLSYRPGYTHSLGDRTYFSRIALSSLAPEESAAIAERVLQVGGLPQRLTQLITARGEGNPFYIEEVTKALVESGALRKTDDSYTLERPAEQVHVPDTIQEVILSRIDRLEKEARDALQLASVIGREFTVRLLNRISDVQAGLEGLLSELKTLELIYERAYFPELSYMFKHALTHDVAYSTLLAERKKSLHRLVAAGIEELYADRLPEQYEALAHHYYEGQDWEKALAYAMKSAEKATRAYANQEALNYYQRAAEVCAKLGDESLVTAQEAAAARGIVNYLIGNVIDAIDDFNRAREIAVRIGDRHGEGVALRSRGSVEYWGHRFTESEESLKQAIAIGEEGYSDILASANLSMWVLLMDTGRLAESKPYAVVANDLVPETGDPDTLGLWAAERGIQEAWEGRFPQCLDLMNRWRQAIETATVNSLYARWVEGLARAGQGDYNGALSVLHEMLATCDRVGETLFRARALNSIGWVLSELENHEEAVHWNLRSEEAALAINAPDPEIESNARLNLADCYMAMGRPDEAAGYLREVERVVRQPTQEEHFALWVYSQHFFASFGELCLAEGDHDGALSLADECILLAESTNRPKNVVKGRRLRGKALVLKGRLEEAEEEIEASLAIARELGNPPQLWKTYLALGELRRAQGRVADGRRAYKDALSVIDEVAVGLVDTKLREAFLKSAHVTAIRELASATP